MSTTSATPVRTRAPLAVSKSRSYDDIVKKLTPMPGSGEVGKLELPPGQFTLYKTNLGETAEGHFAEFPLADWVPNVEHTIEKSMYQHADWVAYNLPKGVVLTLAQWNRKEEDIMWLGQGKVADLRKLGVCAELVGTGKTKAARLLQLDLRDSLGMFFWRRVDLQFGAIELFRETDFKGARSTLFLSEWPAGRVHPLSGWALADKISSAKWHTLDERTTAAFFQHSDGKGRFYANIKGWGGMKDLKQFGHLGMDDKWSSWRWDHVRPVIEVIDSFELVVNPEEGTSVTTAAAGINDSDQVQEIKLLFNHTDVQQMTCEVSDIHSSGVSASYGMSLSAGADVGLGSVETTATWDVGLSFDYSREEKSSNTFSTSIALGFENLIKVPARSSYTASMEIKTGKVTEQPKVLADRWYDFPVSGATLDEENGLWKIEKEKIPIVFDGGLASKIVTAIKAVALPPNDQRSLEDQKGSVLRDQMGSAVRRDGQLLVGSS